jgi:hypothetical protein
MDEGPQVRDSVNVVDSTPSANTAIRLLLSKGQIIHYTYSTVQDIQQQVLNKQIDIHQEIGYGWLFTVAGIGPNNTGGDSDYNIQVTYDKVTYKQKSPSANIDYSSERPVPANLPPLARLYSALKGAGFILVVGKDGKVKKLLNHAGMVDKVVQNLGDGNDSMQKLLKRDFPKELGEKNLLETFRQLFTVYPQNEVQTGSHWTIDLKKDIGMAYLSHNSYTLSSINGSEYVLGLNSEVSPNPDAEINNVGASYKLGGSISGTIRLEKNTGVIKSSAISEHLTGSISIPAPQPGSQPLTIPIKIANTIHLEKDR